MTKATNLLHYNFHSVLWQVKHHHWFMCKEIKHVLNQKHLLYLRL